MELLLKNEQGELEINFENLAAIVKNEELLSKLKLHFFPGERKKRKVYAFEYSLNEQGLYIHAYVGGTLLDISYWPDSNLYSYERFGVVDAFDLLKKGGHQVAW